MMPSCQKIYTAWQERRADKGSVHHESFCIGTRVEHPTRGSGLIEEVSINDRGKPYKVKFDNGEVHYYSHESAMKLKTAKTNFLNTQRAKHVANEEDILNMMQGAHTHAAHGHMHAHSYASMNARMDGRQSCGAR